MKKIIILSFFLITLLIGTALIVQVRVEGSTADLPRIIYNQVFDQSEEVYFVYFWRKDCPRCQEFEPHVVRSYNSGIPIFVVDMNDPVNQVVWYQRGAYRENDLMGRAGDITGISDYTDLKMSIEGTPTLIKIQQGTVTDHVAGVTPAISLLGTFTFDE